VGLQPQHRVVRPRASWRGRCAHLDLVEEVGHAVLNLPCFWNTSHSLYLFIAMEATRAYCSGSSNKLQTCTPTCTRLAGSPISAHGVAYAQVFDVGPGHLGEHLSNAILEEAEGLVARAWQPRTHVRYGQRRRFMPWQCTVYVLHFCCLRRSPSSASRTTW
jgi:hypothetical protein